MSYSSIPHMGLFSYTQDREDVVLARFLADVEKGFYVDVGACLPTAGSVTKYFYDRLWHGINIEPLFEYFVALCQERPRDVNLNTGISNIQGKGTLHVCGGMSTLCADTARKIEEKQQGIFQTTEIKLCTLTDIFDAYVRDHDVHFLKIDVETHEREVIESMDFSKYQPWILCIESTFPYTMDPLHEQWEHILIENEYIFALQYGVNRYYIHKHKYHERIHIFETNDFAVVSA